MQSRSRGPESSTDSTIRGKQLYAGFTQFNPRSESISNIRIAWKCVRYTRVGRHGTRVAFYFTGRSAPITAA